MLRKTRERPSSKPLVSGLAMASESRPFLESLSKLEIRGKGNLLSGGMAAMSLKMIHKTLQNLAKTWRNFVCSF